METNGFQLICQFESDEDTENNPFKPYPIQPPCHLHLQLQFKNHKLLQLDNHHLRQLTNHFPQLSTGHYPPYHLQLQLKSHKLLQLGKVHHLLQLTNYFPNTQPSTASYMQPPSWCTNIMSSEQEIYLMTETWRMCSSAMNSVRHSNPRSPLPSLMQHNSPKSAVELSGII